MEKGHVDKIKTVLVEWEHTKQWIIEFKQQGVVSNRATNICYPDLKAWISYFNV